MSQTIRRVSAAILLLILICVPFWDWKLGAVLWMSAWLVFIFQNLYSGHTRKWGGNNETGDGKD